jgi:hypothetical protein
MKTEWDFFADVQQRLAEGEPLVTYYFVERLVWPPDAQRGLVLDAQGTEYELGSEYQRALNACIRARRISWRIRFPERTMCFGPGVQELDAKEKVTWRLGPDSQATIEPDPD